MFVGPLSVSVSVVVRVCGVFGGTVVGVMGVDWAPTVAVVGPATVRVAVTVLEVGEGASDTELDGRRGGEMEDEETPIGSGVLVESLVAVLTTVAVLNWAQ